MDTIRSDTEQAVRAISDIAEIIGRIDGAQRDIAVVLEQQAATAAAVDGSVGAASTGAAQIARTTAGVSAAATRTTEGMQDARVAIDDVARVAQEMQPRSVASAGSPGRRPLDQCARPPRRLTTGGCTDHGSRSRRRCASTRSRTSPRAGLLVDHRGPHLGDVAGAEVAHQLQGLAVSATSSAISTFEPVSRPGRGWAAA